MLKRKSISKEKHRMKDGKMARFIMQQYSDKPEESNPNLACEDYELTAGEKRLEALEESRLTRKNLTKQDKQGLGQWSDMIVCDAEKDEDWEERKKDEEFLARKRMRAHLNAIDTQKKEQKRKKVDDEVQEDTETQEEANKK